MSLSKFNTSGTDPAICYDKADIQPIFYHASPTEGEVQLNSDVGYVPMYFGDTLLYVCGARGSGKSTYVNMYIKSYVKTTGNKIFFISRLKADTSIDLPERSLRIDIKDIFKADITDLKDSLLVFDDINNANFSPAEQNAIQSYIIDVIENSRHYNISVILTSHQISNYAKTRAILNECSAIVVYPQYSNNYQIIRSLKVYFGLDEQQIERIMSETNSRWVQVQTRNPKFVLTEHEVYTYRFSTKLFKNKNNPPEKEKNNHTL